MAIDKVVIPEAAKLETVVEAAKQADKVLLPYWMGPEFGEHPTDEQMYNAIACLHDALAALEAQDDNTNRTQG